MTHIYAKPRVPGSTLRNHGAILVRFDTVPQYDTRTYGRMEEKMGAYFCCSNTSACI